MKTTQAKKQESLVPQELLKERSHANRSLTIGIPKENQKIEKRLAFTPEAVDMIVDAGHEVFFEKGAGLGVNYSDAAYAESGAFIAKDTQQVFSCDLIFKIAPPTLEEVQLMKKKATLLSMLQISDMHAESIKSMCEKQIHAVGYELMNVGGITFPVRDSISEIEGAVSLLVASELLSNEKGGKGILLGGISGVSPTEIVIIGAGVAGTVAARAAIALGASVKVFDSDISKLRKLQSELGMPVFTSVFQPNVLVNALKTADVVIGAMRYIDDSVRYVVSEGAVQNMKKASLIIDLRVSQGGCFETTCFLPKDHPMIFDKYGVLHYCVPNVSSRIARTTAMALSNIFTPLINRIGDFGGVAGMATADVDFRSGLYMYNGKLVNSYVAKHFNLSANDIALFLSVF